VGVLDLRQGSRAKVFRHTVEFMRSDEALNKAIRTWLVWDGADIAGVLRQPLSSTVPSLLLEPNIGQMAWYSPDAHSGYLIVKLRMALQSMDADDYLNLWEAIENSLYPYDQRSRQLLFQQQLRDLGAETGQWEFATPAGTPINPGDSGSFACEGMMRIAVTRPFNP
jgi:hypothetical protein